MAARPAPLWDPKKSEFLSYRLQNPGGIPLPPAEVLPIHIPHLLTGSGDPVIPNTEIDGGGEDSGNDEGE